MFNIKYLTETGPQLDILMIHKHVVKQLPTSKHDYQLVALNMLTKTHLKIFSNKFDSWIKLSKNDLS